MKAKVNADAVRLLDSLAGRRKALRMSLRAVAEALGPRPANRSARALVTRSERKAGYGDPDR